MIAEGGVGVLSAKFGDSPRRSSKSHIHHPSPPMSDERGQKRRRLCTNLHLIPPHLGIVARPVGVQILAHCVGLLTSVSSCGARSSLKALNSFFNVLSVLWGAEAAFQISSAIYSGKIPATLAAHVRRVNKALVNAVATRGHSFMERLMVGVGYKKLARFEDEMPEGVWRSNVLFMLKSLEQNVQRLLARSDVASAAPTPGAWHLSEHMSASEAASPISKMSEVGEESFNGALDISYSSTPDFLDASEHGTTIAGLLDAHSAEEPDPQDFQLSTGPAFDKVQRMFESLPEFQDTADLSGNSRVGPPPPSWGQVDNRQRLSAMLQADTMNEEHTSAIIPEAPGSLSQIASACEKWDSTTPPGPISRDSWAPQAELQWFTRSPCFRLSSAQQAARLQVAQSCVEDPPAQEATYGALLSRLPQELRT